MSMNLYLSDCNVAQCTLTTLSSSQPKKMSHPKICDNSKENFWASSELKTCRTDEPKVTMIQYAYESAPILIFLTGHTISLNH